MDAINNSRQFKSEDHQNNRYNQFNRDQDQHPKRQSQFFKLNKEDEDQLSSESSINTHQIQN